MEHHSRAQKERERVCHGGDDAREDFGRRLIEAEPDEREGGEPLNYLFKFNERNTDLCANGVNYVIGRTLTEAVAYLEGKGFDIESIEYVSDQVHVASKKTNE